MKEIKELIDKIEQDEQLMKKLDEVATTSRNLEGRIHNRNVRDNTVSILLGVASFILVIILCGGMGAVAGTRGDISPSLVFLLFSTSSVLGLDIAALWLLNK